jgi:hypothetical protein
VMYVAKMMNHSIKNGTSKLIRSKKIKKWKKIGNY